jgi:G3E family GTPase
MPVPTNLITGFLGVGKTTAILDLLARRTAKEKWAVLVNEFGQVGIDGATLSQDGVAVREVPGGCICCTAQLPLKVALTKLLREVKPDRLIIEPTGVGHPAGIIDVLRDAALAPYLQLVNVITLVDPRQFSDARFAAMETYQDQLNLADVLVANKCDLATAEELNGLLKHAGAMYPPKLLVTQTERGHLDPAWLDLRSDHAHVQEGGHGEAADFSSRGWVFDPATVFDAKRVQELFRRWSADAAILRAKGILRVGRDWRRYDLAGGQVESASAIYRRDSRIEFVAAKIGADVEVDWQQMENLLRGAITAPASGAPPGATVR